MPGRRTPLYEWRPRYAQPLRSLMRTWSATPSGGGEALRADRSDSRSFAVAWQRAAASGRGSRSPRQATVLRDCPSAVETTPGTTSSEVVVQTTDAPRSSRNRCPLRNRKEACAPASLDQSEFNSVTCHRTELRTLTPVWVRPIPDGHIQPERGAASSDASERFGGCCSVAQATGSGGFDLCSVFAAVVRYVGNRYRHARL